MAFKSFLFVSLVGAAILAAPVAEAQLGLIGGLLGLIRIQGTLFCTANGNMGANGTATPVFPSMLALISLSFFFLFFSFCFFFLLIDSKVSSDQIVMIT
jgi:hypothetical protein